MRKKVHAVQHSFVDTRTGMASTQPGFQQDFLSHLPYIVSLDFVLYSVSRPVWLCPVRSTLLQYVLDSSSTCRLTQIVLGTDSASICSYSSLYLASHALLHSLTHASSGLVYKEDILCCSSSVFRSQTEDSSCAAYSRAPSLLGSEVHQVMSPVL